MDSRGVHIQRLDDCLVNHALPASPKPNPAVVNLLVAILSEVQIVLLPMPRPNRRPALRTDYAQARGDRKELSVDAKPAKVPPSFYLHVALGKSRAEQNRRGNDQTIAAVPHSGFLREPSRSHGVGVTAAGGFNQGICHASSWYPGVLVAGQFCLHSRKQNTRRIHERKGRLRGAIL